MRHGVQGAVRKRRGGGADLTGAAPAKGSGVGLSVISSGMLQTCGGKPKAFRTN